ncbi:MAG: hypothetical protein Q7N50_07635 [Armatimonadota bacterium]|nr:hypothetical protein [Armatimonadota bacterium]
MKVRHIWMCVLMAVCWAGSPALGYLKVHPENPHYFQETKTGKAVMLAGCAGLVPSAYKYNYVHHLNEMISGGVTYGRVWHFLPWEGKNAIWPWGRSDVPGAPMGGCKIDMNTWNPVYWHRMRDSMSRADKAGIYMEIHLFDRCGMSPPDAHRYKGNPWASDNNVNNLETPTSDKDGTPEFYMYATKPNLRAQQERYVKKMIDETISCSNIIYEIENEHWQYDNPDFASHYAQFVKEHIAKNYPKSPRLVSYSSLQDDLEAFYKIPWVDIVNRHYGNECERNPATLNDYIERRWKLNKAINIDEFANGVVDPDLLRKMCWIIITSGGNFHIEDAEEPSNPFGICGNIRKFNEGSNWNFIRSAPNKKLVTSGEGYCMAQPGVEYVLYFPAGGEKSVAVSPGKYKSMWWNPTKSGFSGEETFLHNYGDRKFTAPDANDWVLHIKKTSNS